MTWAAFLAQFGITAVSAAALAYGLFQWFGKHWLEGQFSKRLEEFKHAKNREIEELRGTINALLDRTVKLQSKEFEVLPLIWEKLHDSYAAASVVASRGQMYAEVTWLGDEQLELMFDKLEVEEPDRAAIRAEKKGMDRQAAFNRLMDGIRMASAYRHQADVLGYVNRSGIFVHPDLRAKIRKLIGLIYDAIDERQFDRQYPSPGATDRWIKADILRNDGKALYEALEDEVQARLWDRRLAATS